LAVATLQKIGTADQRLQQASELLKRHKHDLELGQKVRMGVQGDQDAADFVMEQLGLNESDPVISGHQAGVKAAQQGTSPGASADPSLVRVASWLKTLEDKGIDPSKAFELVISRAQDDVEQAIFGDVDQLAVSNEVLGPLMKNPKVSRFVVDELHGHVRSRLRNGEPDGPQTYLPAIREVAAKYKALGIQDGTSAKPKPTATDIRTLIGLGPATTSGAGGDPDAEKVPEPTTPYRAAPGEYAKNFSTRFNHYLAQRLADASTVGAV
jgi:hypothetical protein